MIWLLIPAIYFTIGLYIYWKTTWEEETLGVAVLAVLIWPVIIVYMISELHAGRVTVKTRKGNKYRRVNGEWERV